MSKKVQITKSQNYTWSQTEESITVSFPVRNVAMKNIDVFYTDILLKVNVPSIRYIAIIDFPLEVDFTSSKNRVQQLDDSLEVFLIKAQKSDKMWDEIQISGLSREEVTERRNDSVKRHQEYKEAEFKKTADRKYKLEGETVKKQMQVENNQREQISTAKENQRLEYVNEMEKDLQSLEDKNKSIRSAHQAGLNSLEDERDAAQKYKAKLKESLWDDEEIETVDSRGVKESSRKLQNQPEPKIYEVSDDDEQEPAIEELEEEEEPMEVPEVRQAQKSAVPFTEKKFPHLPTRESHNKEAPFPKSKKKDPKAKNEDFIDVEDKDPVWLKDKADHFFKQHDYTAACAAYSKALKEEPDFLMCKINRSTAWIKTRQYNFAIDDCREIISQVDAMKEDEREGEDKVFYDKIVARSLVKRGACFAWTSKFDEAVADFDKVIDTESYRSVLSDQEISSLQKDKAVIQQRQKSHAVKTEGDRCFFREDYSGAVEKYEESLEVDKENEYSVANISAIALKKLEYTKCIERTTDALEIIERFQDDTKSFSTQNELEIKLLLRRSKSYEMTNQWELAKKDLDKVLMMEPNKAEAKANLKVVQGKIDEVVFGEYREQANELLKQRKFQAALDMYEKALKVTRRATTLDNIAVYVNKIACLLSLDKLDRVIHESNDAIRLIRNFKNRFQVKGEEATRLKAMDLRVAVRKGNALAKLTRTSEAIGEYERALTIDPTNAQVKKDLDILRKTK